MAKRGCRGGWASGAAVGHPGSSTGARARRRTRPAGIARAASGTLDAEAGGHAQADGQGGAAPDGVGQGQQPVPVEVGLAVDEHGEVDGPDQPGEVVERLGGVGHQGDEVLLGRQDLGGARRARSPGGRARRSRSIVRRVPSWSHDDSARWSSTGRWGTSGWRKAAS